MLEEIKQIKDLETIFNMLDNIDDFNLSEDEYAKVINYLARKYIEVEKYHSLGSQCQGNRIHYRYDRCFSQENQTEFQDFGTEIR